VKYQNLYELKSLNSISNCLGKHFQLDAQIRVHGKKRTSGNKITGIQVLFFPWNFVTSKIYTFLLLCLHFNTLITLQFSQKNHQRVMITSEDSKVRILEGIELVQTYKGRALSNE